MPSKHLLAILRRQGAVPVSPPALTPLPTGGNNGGPPLDDDTPPWGIGPIGNWFEWRDAHDEFWKSVPAEIAVRRARKAEALGLTYAEYTVEIARGRYLGPDDTTRIAEIKRQRPLRY